MKRTPSSGQVAGSERQSSSSAGSTSTSGPNVPTSPVPSTPSVPALSPPTLVAPPANIEPAREDEEDFASTSDQDQPRLLIVANRLPVSAKKLPDGTWQLQASSGGLVSALLGVRTRRMQWIGWPGVWAPPGASRDALAALLESQGYIPVWLDEATQDLHYNGFCNSVLWNLFHYVHLTTDTKLLGLRNFEMQWQAYQRANLAFKQAVLAHHEETDDVWIHDYHLMLLPTMLKEAAPRMKVGFFLHTPFPSSEIYRTLPVREEILKGVLKADLIGFHTYDYARHFISSCTRILGLEGTPEGVEDNGVVCRVAAFPIGIDPERFSQALESPDVQRHIAELQQRFAGKKVMLGVDRLDMIKGIPQKLLAVEKFLEEHPEWGEKVVLLQIAVPTRIEVPEYQRLRSTVHEVVGRINGKFGSLTHVPIVHLDRNLSFTELVALYAVTDVCLVNSLRDGMNLVSFEFVACQSHKDTAGVLVLSEFAGAAQSLGAGAILVNPWNVHDMAAAIEYALTMADEERRERHRQNHAHVTLHTAQTWADLFISELNDTHVAQELRTKQLPLTVDRREYVRSFVASKRRLIIVGFNAALTLTDANRSGGSRTYEQLRALTRVHPSVHATIRKLAMDPRTRVVIFSGSERARLDEVFGDLPVWLAAENGVFMRPPNGEWEANYEKLNLDWMESVQLVFDYFCERTPRSFVEARETSLVWSWKYADAEFGRLQARDMLQHLYTGPISNASCDIVQGAKSVEVRPVGVSKGGCLIYLLRRMAEIDGPRAMAFDFVSCVGHFMRKDENIYALFEGKASILHETVARAHTPRPVDPARPEGGHSYPSTTAVSPSSGALQQHPAPFKRPSYLASEALNHSLSAPPSPRSALEGLEGASPSTNGLHQPDSDPSTSPQADALHEPNGHYSGSAPQTSSGLSSAYNKSSQPVNASSRLSSAPLHPSRLAQGSSAQDKPITLGTPEPPPSLLRSSAHLPRVDSLPDRASPLSGTSSRALHNLKAAERQQARERRMSRSSVDETRIPGLTLPPRNLFTFTVGRKQSLARYLLSNSQEVAGTLESLASSLGHSEAEALALYASQEELARTSAWNRGPEGGEEQFGDDYSPQVSLSGGAINAESISGPSSAMSNAAQALSSPAPGALSMELLKLGAAGSESPQALLGSTGVLTGVSSLAPASASVTAAPTPLSSASAAHTPVGLDR